MHTAAYEARELLASTVHVILLPWPAGLAEQLVSTDRSELPQLIIFKGLASGFRIWAFRVKGFGCLGFRIKASRVKGFGCFGFRIKAFRVKGFGCFGFKV